MKKIVHSPVIRYVVLGLLAAVVGINVFVLNASRLARDAMPMPFGYGASVVLSGSMEPTLSVGDLLIARQQESYEVGDVVVYQDGRTPVVHRIVSIEGEEVITQGDANNTPDDAIALSYIKGEVILAIPMVGHAINLIKTPIGTILLLALAIWLLEHSFRKDKKENKEELDAIREEIQRLKEEQNK